MGARGREREAKKKEGREGEKKRAWRWRVKLGKETTLFDDCQVQVNLRIKQAKAMKMYTMYRLVLSLSRVIN